MLKIALLVHILCYFAYGRRTSNHGKTRMLNAKEISQRDFPYLAGIGTYMLGSLWVLACSGTIISRRAVLTAASCHYFERTDKLIYITTNTSFFGAEGKAPNHSRIVMEIMDHPDFKPRNAAGRYDVYNLNDLAVMKVSEHEPFSIEFEPFYPQIIGPQMKLYKHMDAMYPLLSSVAYGIDEINHTLTSKELLATPFAYECQKIFGYRPAQNSFCVHAHRRSDPVSCGLDIGGPLIWRGVLIGVGFMYTTCGPILRDLPKYTEFANLQKSYEFIKKHVNFDVTFVDELPTLH